MDPVTKAIEEARDLVRKAKGEGYEGSPGAISSVGPPAKAKHSAAHTEDVTEGTDERKTPEDQVAGTSVSRKKKAGATDANVAKATEAKTEKTPETDETEATETKGEEPEVIERSVTADPDVAKAVDASAYLAGLTDQIDAALNGFNTTLAKGVFAIGRLVEANAELAKSNADLRDLVEEQAARIDKLERQPNERKGIVKAAGGGPVERSLGGATPITKAQIADRLADLANKGVLSPMDVSMFEATGNLSLHAQQVLGVS